MRIASVEMATDSSVGSQKSNANAHHELGGAMNIRQPTRPRLAHRIACVVVTGIAVMVAAAPRADGLLDGLVDQVESAVKNKAREIVECAADDAKCAKKAQKQGKEVRTVPSTAPAATAAGGAGSNTQSAPSSNEEDIDGDNPYALHGLSEHPAYVLAKRLAAAKSQRQVEDLLLEAFDRMHVGVYAHDGRRILGGAERGPKDFFLYDFQWRMIAKAFYSRNSMSFDQHARMLGAAVLNLKDTSAVPETLGKALEQRYDEAKAKPDEPMNFVALLIDGLARRQPIPYTLEEPYRLEEAGIRVDPAMSALIMIDFFTRPPAPSSRVSFEWLPSIISTAHADGPCDMIKGDDEQGYWGRGTDIVGDLGQELPGLAGKAFGAVGNATGVTAAIGDLLVLYGMSIELKPQPIFIHLNHQGENGVAGIEATVTFDAQGVPDEVLKCGWLIGKQMPSNGGIKGVELTWDFSPVLLPQLQVHESMFDGYGKSREGNHIVATSGGYRTITDEGGKSIFVLQPNECPRRDGQIREKNYMASVDARYVSRGIPTPGLLGFGLILKLGPGAIETLMGGRSAYARFAAQWHEKAPPPRGY
jgi:hypothetical protein